MASQLKSIVAVVGLASGASQSVAHGLQNNGLKLIPDSLVPSLSGKVTISADDTNVTITNQSSGAVDVAVLCESWHSIERVFGDVATRHLTPQPFVAAQAVAAALIAGSIVYGSGQDGVADFDGVNVFPFAALVGSTYTLNRDVFIATGSRIRNGITVATAGFKGFCNGTFTVDAGGILSCDGKNAAGGVAGGSSALGTLGIGVAGGNGRANNTGLPGSNQANTLGDASAAGGAGGAGGANAGGAGGTYTPNALNGGGNFLTPMLTGFLFNTSSGGNQATVTIIGGGAGGGGGGSDNAGVTGGGGGGGGGVLVWHAADFVNNGTVRALGGNGAAAAGAGGNGGGGGGGGGGIILSLATLRSGAGVYLTTGGAPGAGFGTGAAGAAGSDGHRNLFSFP